MKKVTKEKQLWNWENVDHADNVFVDLAERLRQPQLVFHKLFYET